MGRPDEAPRPIAQFLANRKAKNEAQAEPMLSPRSRARDGQEKSGRSPFLSEVPGVAYPSPLPGAQSMLFFSNIARARPCARESFTVVFYG